MIRPRALAPLLAAAALAGGCSELLPKSQAEVRSEWNSFDEARAGTVATAERVFGWVPAGAATGD